MRENYFLYILWDEGKKKTQKKKKELFNAVCGERNLMHREWISPDV